MALTHQQASQHDHLRPDTGGPPTSGLTEAATRPDRQDGADDPTTGPNTQRTASSDATTLTTTQETTYADTLTPATQPQETAPIKRGRSQKRKNRRYRGGNGGQGPEKHRTRDTFQPGP